MKRTICALMLAALAAGAARAQVDPDPDGMGIYVDTADGYSPCADASYAQTVHLTLFITHPSLGQVGAWSARVTNVANAAAYGQWVLPPESLNIGESDVYDGPCGYIVAYRLPLLPDAGGFVALMSMDLIIFDASQPVELYVAPYPEGLMFDDAPAYMPDPDTSVRCQVSTGGYDLPVCVINGGCGVIATEPVSWGRVKNLYR